MNDARTCVSNRVRDIVEAKCVVFLHATPCSPEKSTLECLFGICVDSLKLDFLQLAIYASCILKAFKLLCAMIACKILDGAESLEVKRF